MKAVFYRNLIRWDYSEEASLEKHRDPTEEMMFYRHVTEGDLDAVQKNCDDKRFLDLNGMGFLYRNPVINLKYHLVVTISMIARLCVEAGLDMETSFQMSDHYILKMDNISTVQGVADLHDEAVLAYTAQMRAFRRQPTAKPITDCLDYIHSHIKERVSVEDLADYTGHSASYISRLFKQELNVSVSDYIREQKVERAKNLLRFSDYSMVEIANHLSFSSQSHFIQIFKNYTGMTPKKYRDTHYKRYWEPTTPPLEKML